MIRKAARTGRPPPPWRFLRPRRRLEEVATSRLGCVPRWALLRRRVCHTALPVLLWLSLRDVKPPRFNSARRETTAMQFSPLAHAALDPRWDGHLLKFNHRDTRTRRSRPPR